MSVLCPHTIPPSLALTCSGPLTPRSPTAFARVRQSVPRTPLMLHVLRGPAGRLAGGVCGWAAAAGPLTSEVNSESVMYSRVNAVNIPISVGSDVISVFSRPSNIKLVRAPNSDGNDVIQFVLSWRNVSFSLVSPWPPRRGRACSHLRPQVHDAGQHRALEAVRNENAFHFSGQQYIATVTRHRLAFHLEVPALAVAVAGQVVPRRHGGQGGACSGGRGQARDVQEGGAGAGVASGTAAAGGVGAFRRDLGPTRTDEARVALGHGVSARAGAVFSIKGSQPSAPPGAAA